MEELTKEALEEIYDNLLENMEDANPDFDQTVDDHFWELV